MRPLLPILFLALLTLCGCSSTGGSAGNGNSVRARQPYKPTYAKLSPEQLKTLAAAERAWRRQDKEFAGAREAVLGDPVTAIWWSRMMASYAAGSRDEYLRQQKSLLEATRPKIPRGYEKAREELKVAGSVAVPVLVHELLRHRKKPRRDLGVDLLVYMGPGITPDLEPYLGDADLKVRRQVLLVLGHMATNPQSRKLLIQNATNPDYSLRAQALEGLARGGKANLPLLRRAALQDKDPFVRRRVIASLGVFKDHKTASVVVAYYKQVLRQGDRDAMRTAQRTLKKMSGVSGKDRTEKFWERWLITLKKQQDNREGR